MAQKKLALSMRGGGARCAGYLGVIKALEEERIEISMMIGSSMGAIIAYLYSIGHSVGEMLDIAGEVKVTEVVSLESLRDRTLLGDERVERLLEKYVGARDLNSGKIPVFVQATNMLTKNTDIFEAGPAKTLLTATIAFPFLLSPIKYQGGLYIDGDVLAGFGASYLREQGAEAIIGVSTGFNPQDNYQDGLPDRFVAPLSLAYHKIQDQDREINELDIYITDVGDTAGFIDFNRARELTELGYKMTMQRMPEIQKLLHKGLLG